MSFRPRFVPKPVSSEFRKAGLGVVLTNPAPTLYQTVVTNGKQDTSSPCTIAVQLDVGLHAAMLAAHRSGRLLSDMMHGGIRRFDLSELMVYSEEAGELLGLRLPQKSFEFSFSAAPETPVLHINVHRKELPVSKSFGGAPFVFVFAASCGGLSQAFVTTRFLVHSKETGDKIGKRTGGVKRGRGPPPCKPYAANAVGPEALLNSLLCDASTGLTASNTPVSSSDPVKRQRSVLVAPHLPRLVTVDEEEKEWEFSKFDMEGEEDVRKAQSSEDGSQNSSGDSCEFSREFEHANQAAAIRLGGAAAALDLLADCGGDTGSPYLDDSVLWDLFCELEG